MMRHLPSEPQRVTPHDLLAEAFLDDPLSVFVEPDRERRRRVLPAVFACVVRAGRLQGRVDVIDGEGVAVWLASGQTHLTWRTLVGAGFLTLPLRLGPAATWRLIRATRDLDKAPPEGSDPDAWYLLLLGVAPQARGRGVVRRLIGPVLENADRTGTPVRLETNNGANVPIYEHFDFDVVAHLETPGLLEQCVMVRPGGTRATR